MRIIKYIAGSIVGVFLFAAAFFIGIKMEQRSMAKAMEKEEVINTIAVVNLDMGIVDGDSRMDYAAQIMKFPGENFVQAGLTEASEGIKNGKYAAYVVIPTTFSESVESINTTPAQSTLQYDVNPRLKNEVKEVVLEDINSFRTLLNTNVAYIYVSAILSEFHEVQDSAELIMQHDNKELDSLNEISAEDLVNVLNFSDMKRIDNQVKDADLSEITAENDQTVKDLSDEYSSKVDEGRADYSNVQRNNEEVTAAAASLKDYVDKADPLADEEGKSLIADGVSELETEVDKYNQKLKDQRQTVNGKILDTVKSEKEKDQTQVNTSLKAMTESLQGSLAAHETNSLKTLQMQADEQLLAIQKENQTEIDNSLAEIQSSLQQYIYTDLQNFTYAKLSEILKEQYECYVSEAEEQLAKVRTAVGQQAQVDFRNLVQEANETYYNDELTPAVTNIKTEIKTELEQLNGTAVTDEDIQRIMDILVMEKFPQVPDVIEEPEEVNADNGIALTEPSFEDESEEWQKIKEKIDFGKSKEDIPELTLTELKLKEAVSASAENKDKNTQVWIELKSTGYTLPELAIDLTETEKTLADEPVKEIESLYTISKKNITNAIDNKIVNVIKTENSKERKEVKSLSKIFDTQLTAYNTSMEGFDPYKYLTKSVLETGASKLNTNLTKAETSLTQKGTEYQQLVSDVYQAADENTQKLQDDMNEASEGTLSKVTNQVAVLKDSRSEINQENIKILEPFSEKLGYMRFGKLPYREAYDFVINPVLLQE